jgi:hypothetical protein
MRSFTYRRAADVNDALPEIAQPESKFLGGGTNLVDLMKMGVERPARLIDITRVPRATIEEHGVGLRIGIDYHQPSVDPIKKETINLSAVLAEIETSVAKIKDLETQITTEKENAKTLVEKYKAESGEVLKSLGIEEAPTKERKVKTPEKILMGVAARSIRKALKNGGKKNVKTVLASALEAVETVAKKKALGEVSADIKTAIEARVNESLAAKK